LKSRDSVLRLQSPEKWYFCWERMLSFIASYIRKMGTDTPTAPAGKDYAVSSRLTYGKWAQTPLQLLLGRRASSLDEPNLILIREGSGPLAGNLALLACVLQGSSYP
jgi:hypothetical protein